MFCRYCKKFDSFAGKLWYMFEVIIKQSSRYYPSKQIKMTCPQELDDWHKFAVKLVLEAGLMMKGASGKSSAIDTKASFADLVTETDKAIESFLFNSIANRYPGHRAIGEETSSLTDAKISWTDDPTWIIDPIDGTTNFVHTFPFSCISIGVTLKKVVVLGIVFSPFLDKLYTSKKGQGSYCNGRPIFVRPCRSLREAIVFFETGSSREIERKSAFIKNLMSVASNCERIRTIGSAALHTCLIAEGSADGFFEFGLHCWDMAGGSLILTEAGGAVLDTSGEQLNLMSRKYIAASNFQVARELAQALVVHVQLEPEA